MKTLSTLLFFLISGGLFAQETLLQSGPMVGYSTMREVALWVQTTEPARVDIRYWDKESPSTSYRTNVVLTEKAKAYTAHLVADEVLPGKVYGYEVRINGREVPRDYLLEFKTQPLWQWRTDAPDFTFAMGSCAYVNEPEFDRPGKPYGSNYQIFGAIHQDRPDFMLWMGDNTYLREADWNSRTGIHHRYTHTRSLPELQPLLGSTHHYATWDDHEFGPNDAVRTFWNRELTKEAFGLFWANPNQGVDGGEGITSTFSWHDVQFFMMDDRWYRSMKTLPEDERQMLGEGQIAWLLEALRFSNATFKCVVVGSSVLNPQAQHETYANYAQEQERLLSALQDADIPGVVFFSGDVHHSEMVKMEREGTYPLYEVVVSPLTAGISVPKENNPLMVPNTLVTEHNYGLVRVEGKSGKRKMVIMIKNTEGKTLWEREILAESLRPEGR